jgi:hypothetical protein
MQTISKTILCSLLMVAGFFVAGCQPTSVAEAEIDNSKLKLVSLTVPNMT